MPAVAVSDTPADEIVRYAQDNNIDLIVMGTHGRRAVAHLLVGSVAERVVRTAPCPVLTVRQPPAAGTKTVPVQEPAADSIAKPS